VDVDRASALLSQLNAINETLRGLYERLPRYLVSPLTRDDIARRDDLILEVQEVEARRAEVLTALAEALN
jgi:hypothetical protein